jgi:hypothetical protein
MSLVVEFSWQIKDLDQQPFANQQVTECGCSSMAELLLPKQIAWVRFPSPAPDFLSSLFLRIHPAETQGRKT